MGMVPKSGPFCSRRSLLRCRPRSLLTMSKIPNPNRCSVCGGPLLRPMAQLSAGCVLFQPLPWRSALEGQAGVEQRSKEAPLRLSDVRPAVPQTGPALLLPPVLYHLGSDVVAQRNAAPPPAAPPQPAAIGYR